MFGDQRITSGMVLTLYRVAVAGLLFAIAQQVCWSFSGFSCFHFPSTIGELVLLGFGGSELRFSLLSTLLTSPYPFGTISKRLTRDTLVKIKQLVLTKL